jgi:hypothetical protein
MLADGRHLQAKPTEGSAKYLAYSHNLSKQRSFMRMVLWDSSPVLESWRIEGIADTVFGMAANAGVTTFLDADRVNRSVKPRSSQVRGRNRNREGLKSSVMDDSRGPIWLTNEVPGASELIAWFGYWPRSMTLRFRLHWRGEPKRPIRLSEARGCYISAQRR